MDNAPAPSILDSLRTVEFRMNLRGYSVDEVDEYLEKVAVEAEAVMAQLRAASERLGHANERIGRLETELHRANAGERPAPEAPPAPAPAPAAAAAPTPPPPPPAPTAARPEPAISDETLQRTLLLAQRFVDQTRRDSEAEAAEVLKRAEERARGMVAQAEDRARQVAGEAEQRLREEVSRLEGSKARLTSEIDTMTRHLDEERTRIRSSLTEALRWLDEGAPSGLPQLSVERPRADAPAAPAAPAAEPASRAEAPAAAAPEQPTLAGQGMERPADPSAPRLRSVPGAGEAESLLDQAPRPE